MFSDYVILLIYKFFSNSFLEISLDKNNGSTQLTPLRFREIIDVMEETIEKKTNGYGKKPLWQWIGMYVVIGIVVYGAIYYFFFAKKGGYNYSQSNQYQAQQTNPTKALEMSPSTTMAMQHITVEGNEFLFNPFTITVKQGQTVMLTFKNSGKYPHNFVGKYPLMSGRLV